MPILSAFHLLLLRGNPSTWSSGSGKNYRGCIHTAFRIPSFPRCTLNFSQSNSLKFSPLTPQVNTTVTFCFFFSLLYDTLTGEWLWENIITLWMSPAGHDFLFSRVDSLLISACFGPPSVHLKRWFILCTVFAIVIFMSNSLINTRYISSSRMLWLLLEKRNHNPLVDLPWIKLYCLSSELVEILEYWI